jgi:hypothetical protein
MFVTRSYLVYICLYCLRPLHHYLLQFPQFRFVELTLALDLERSRSLDNKRQKNAVFLVEEVIAEDQQGPFRKYLNNVSSIPLPMSNKEDNDRARFLAFSQHVQYWKTERQVFVSDYQGK